MVCTANIDWITCLAVMNTQTARFADALAAVETLPMEDQVALVDVVNKRIISARRRAMAQEIAEARADYRRGKVKRGSAADMMRELSKMKLVWSTEFTRTWHFTERGGISQSRPGRRAGAR